MAKNYENLDIWKKSINLAALVYKTTKSFPEDCHSLYYTFYIQGYA